MEHRLELPLPPSINKAYTRNKYTGQHLYTPEARDYMDAVAWIVKTYMKRKNLLTKTDFFYLDLDWFLGSRNADSHNYFKLLADALEKGGFCENDKFIMNRTQSIDYDKLKPRVVLNWD